VGVSAKPKYTRLRGFTTLVNTMATFGSKSTAAEVLAGKDLSGQVIIVTGGNGGLGLETVKALACVGANVMMTSRSVQAGEEALLTIQSPEMKVFDLILQYLFFLHFLILPNQAKTKTGVT
jgi:hypothetical protein